MYEVTSSIAPKHVLGRCIAALQVDHHGVARHAIGTPNVGISGQVLRLPTWGERPVVMYEVTSSIAPKHVLGRCIAALQFDPHGVARHAIGTPNVGISGQVLRLPT